MPEKQNKQKAEHYEKSYSKRTDEETAGGAKGESSPSCCQQRELIKCDGEYKTSTGD
jgi:hypothetical protein